MTAVDYPEFSRLVDNSTLQFAYENQVLKVTVRELSLFYEKQIVNGQKAYPKRLQNGRPISNQQNSLTAIRDDDRISIESFIGYLFEYGANKLNNGLNFIIKYDTSNIKIHLDVIDPLEKNNITKRYSVSLPQVRFGFFGTARLDHRIGYVNEIMTQTTSNLDGFKQRFSSLESVTNNKFVVLDHRIGYVNESMTQTTSNLDGFKQRLSSLETVTNNKLDVLEKKVSVYIKKTNEQFHNEADCLEIFSAAVKKQEQDLRELFDSMKLMEQKIVLLESYVTELHQENCELKERVNKESNQPLI